MRLSPSVFNIALDGQYKTHGNSLLRMVRHHQRKPGAICSRSFFVTKMSRRAAGGRKCHKKNHLKPSKNAYFIHPFSQ